MAVSKLTVHNFRNLANQHINLNANVNFLIGDNGSGKSSVLEAIFYLAHGKSFRTAKSESLVTFENDFFVTSCSQFNDTSLGIKKTVSDSSVELKLNGKRVNKLSDLAVNMAVQIITPETFKLFFGGAKERRKFFDLGVFHVKHSFSQYWKDFSKTLKQRNACLKNSSSHSMLPYWTEQFCLLSENVCNLRVSYLELLKTELDSWLSILMPELKDKLKLQYVQGWNQKKELLDILNDNLDKEKELGYTTSGAHKFDIRFVYGRQSLEQTLSRGQQKLFLLALTLAQTKVIENVKRVKPILLIDDVGAELDKHARQALASSLNKVDCQVFVSAIDELDLTPLVPQDNNYKMFHVKHGEIFEKSE